MDREKTYFEQQREALIGEIAMVLFLPSSPSLPVPLQLTTSGPQSFEHVLASINKLNRSLESVIAVGNEFSSVEALWSQFENVMAKDEDGRPVGGDQQQQGQEEGCERKDAAQP
jgi:DASH complex subunit DAD1